MAFFVSLLASYVCVYLCAYEWCMSTQRYDLRKRKRRGAHGSERMGLEKVLMKFTIAKPVAMAAKGKHNLIGC